MSNLIKKTDDSVQVKRALITGITGQDGSYLAEFLISQGYQVHGIIRRTSIFNTVRIDHIYQDPHQSDPPLYLHYGDLTDGTGLRRILQQVEPDEVYNLAAQSHVKVSFEQPEYTADTVAMGTLRLLEALRDYMEVCGKVRMYQAASSGCLELLLLHKTSQLHFTPQSLCRIKSGSLLVCQKLS